MISNFLEKKILSATIDSFFDNVFLIVVALKSDGTIVYANPYFLKVTGYTFEEIDSKNWFDIFIPVNKVDTVLQTMSAIVDNRYAMKSENPIVKKDKNQLTVEWHNVPIIENDEVTGALSIGVDTTNRNEIELLLKLNEKTMRERAEMYEQQNTMLQDTKRGMLNLLDDAKRLEEELQQEKRSVERKVEERTDELNQEKARLVSAINSFPSGIIMTDTERNILLTNDVLGEVLKVHQVEWQLEDVASYFEGYLDFMKEYNTVEKEHRPVLIKDVDMGRRFLEVYLAPVFLDQEDSKTVGIIILITDITERKILERSKDEFFSIASHELRTPLTAVRGNVEMIKKHFSGKVNDPNFTEMIDDIKASAERLIALVNEFLNMSRLEQGKITFDRIELSITDLIDEVVRELNTVAASKNLYIKVETPLGKVPSVLADRNRVKEILINLVNNALTYTIQGGATVGLDYDENFMRVYVTDTGKGIPPQNQNLLFRKFQQAQPSLYVRDSSRSTGLGLYISKLMVEAMGGKIYLEKSEETLGSVFVFTLPLAR